MAEKSHIKITVQVDQNQKHLIIVAVITAVAWKTRKLK